MYNQKHLNDQDGIVEGCFLQGIFFGLKWFTIFHFEAGKYFIFNFSKLNATEINTQAIWITISEMLRENHEFV